MTVIQKFLTVVKKHRARIIKRRLNGLAAVRHKQLIFPLAEKRIKKSICKTVKRPVKIGINACHCKDRTVAAC